MWASISIFVLIFMRWPVGSTTFLWFISQNIRFFFSPQMIMVKQQINTSIHCNKFSPLEQWQKQRVNKKLLYQPNSINQHIISLVVVLLSCVPLQERCKWLPCLNRALFFHKIKNASPNNSLSTYENSSKIQTANNYLIS